MVCGHCCGFVTAPWEPVCVHPGGTLAGESAEARDGLIGLWLAPAALLNQGQPPRVNGPSTRPTTPVGHQTMDAGRWSGARKRIQFRAVQANLR